MGERSTGAVQKLISMGLVNADTEVLSSHNNLIMKSPSERVVYRIAEIASMLSREDPGNLHYSHEAAWVSADVAPVVRPINRRPVEDEGFIVSSYPERQQIDWTNHDPKNALDTILELNNSLGYVSSAMELRTIDIPSYSLSRLDFAAASEGTKDSRSLDIVKRIFEKHSAEYPFYELLDADMGLVHGDLHATNLVRNDAGGAELIDMDSLSIGPKTYDIASWRVRHELGDIAPVDIMLEMRRLDGDWNEDLFRSLMGWKIISSMTHVLRYEQNHLKIPDRVRQLGEVGLKLKSLTFYPEEIGDL